jgi:UDP-N-acetylmuramoyl-tripeptide--D-alanyl-D-alanine ligase
MTIIDDCYNANPLSMRFGLDSLAETALPVQRRVAFLGRVGELARYYDPDQWFADSYECAQQVRGLIAPGDCVLVKGSRSVHMDAIVERLRAVSF